MNFFVQFGLVWFWLQKFYFSLIFGDQRLFVIIFGSVVRFDPVLDFQLSLFGFILFSGESCWNLRVTGEAIYVENIVH